MAIDLHLHTTASDGTLTPRELVVAAADKQLTTIAVTDHDTLAGLGEAADVGHELGVEVIPGIELTTEVGAREYHVLGYYVDLGDGSLEGQLGTLLEARHERGRKMVLRLNELGVSLDFDEVLREAHGGAIGRPHVARALHRRGHVRRSQEAFDRWIGRGRPAYVPRHKLSPFDAIELLARNGALSALAHPALCGTDAYIRTLAQAGLRGLEVYHPEHGAAAVQRYAALADELGLVQTGGSDSHGPRGTRPVEIGSVPVPDELADRLRAAHAPRRAARPPG